MDKPKKIDCRKKETRNKHGEPMNTSYALGWNKCLKVCEEYYTRQLAQASKEESKWISVKEQTPDKDIQVLCTDGKLIAVGDCCKGHLWNIEQTWMTLGKITHWMPLPEAPEVK